jgi:hypothetical protein
MFAGALEEGRPHGPCGVLIMSESPEGHERTSRRKQVQAMLRHEDSVSLRGSLGRLFKGIGFCAIIGIVVATALTFGISALFNKHPIGWFAWFGIYWLLLIVALVISQRRRHADYLVGSLNAPDHLGDDSSPLVVRTPYLMAVLWGPRAILDGVAAVRGKWTARQNAAYKRAAQMVLEMAKYDGGVEIRALMHPPEDMAIFNEVIDWLEAHDYLGKSSDGERFWLTTIGKNKLAAHGIHPKVGAV